MQTFTAKDGCPAFRATVTLDDYQIERDFRWGVVLGTEQRPRLWGIPSEANDITSPEHHQRYHAFTLHAGAQTHWYYLTHCRRLGANKRTLPGERGPAIQFATWAPNSINVELVRGDIAGAISVPDALTDVGATVVMLKEATGQKGLRTCAVSSQATRFEPGQHAPGTYRAEVRGVAGTASASEVLYPLTADG